MAATGGEDGDVSMTQLVSKRPFSGYWEYHIEAALFTSPPIGNHSGAPLFNQRGELPGIGSLFVMDALGQNTRLPGNKGFVPVDLLKPILGELQQTGSSKLSRRPWLGPDVHRAGWLRERCASTRTAGSRPPACSRATWCWRWTAPGGHAGGVFTSRWQHANPDDEITLTVLQGAEVKPSRQGGGPHEHDDEAAGFNLPPQNSYVCRPALWGRSDIANQPEHGVRFRPEPWVHAKWTVALQIQCVKRY